MSVMTTAQFCRSRCRVAAHRARVKGEFAPPPCKCTGHFFLEGYVKGYLTREMPDRDNGRLQNELGWHDDRGNLLRFLDDPGIEPTNNRAERALRGAVIARKVSHCSKNEDGADAFSAFTSVLRTLARKGGGQSVVDGLCGVFNGAPVHARST